MQARRATVARSMAIYLIRHGETAGNAALVVQKPDIPLSPHGIDQARRLARRLTGEGIGQILSSDLTRAAMTAEAVGETTGAPIRFDPLLHERNFGDVRGTPYAELSFDLFAPDYDPPGGESWERFEARMDEAWVRIQRAADRCEENLGVVTHGLVCRSVVARRTRAWTWAVSPGATPRSRFSTARIRGASVSSTAARISTRPSRKRAEPSKRW